MNSVYAFPWVYKMVRLSYRIGLYLLVLLGAIAFSIPFIWMIRTAVMPSYQVLRYPIEWIPEKIDLSHLFTVFSPGYQFTFQGFLWNSFVLSLLTAFGAALSASFVAFGFARLPFPGRDALFVVLLATMVLPEHVRLVPTYLLFTKLGWVGSYAPLVVPSYVGPAFSVFLLRQFFMTIPGELDDSAYIDGCDPLGLFVRVHLPLSLPALGVVMIFQFTHMWNEFLLPLLYIKRAARFPVSVGLRLYQGQYKDVQIQALMAASLISILPTLIIFFLAQRHFIQGIVITGIKG
jgi:ABC-type glycerol-3-phosphate transport system permease component